MPTVKLLNMIKTLFIYCKIFILCSLFLGSSQTCNLFLENNGPVVIGANVTFSAKVNNTDKKSTSGNFSYNWSDSIGIYKNVTFIGGNNVVWNVTYPTNTPTYEEYNLTVYAQSCVSSSVSCLSRTRFSLTDFLNGHLDLFYNSTKISTEYVPSSENIDHIIDITPADHAFIMENSTWILTYWYIDCKLVNVTSSLTFQYKYMEPDKLHYINALVVATHGIKSSRNDTNITYNLSSYNPEILTDFSSNNVTKSDLITNNHNFIPDIPFSCSTGSLGFTTKTHKRNRTIGLFSKRIKVKAAITNLDIEGNMWLKHEEILNLQIWCNGSAPFKYCIYYQDGIYNATGNEKCRYGTSLSSCNIKVTHYSLDPNSKNYTVLLIIQNDINKVVRSIGINVYEGKCRVLYTRCFESE